MTPSAHLQTVVEILDSYDPCQGPLALFIKNFLASRRYAGSKDRRHIKELVFCIIRVAPLLLEALREPKWRSNLGRHLLLTYLSLQERWPLDKYDLHFTSRPYAPPSLTPEEVLWLNSLKDFKPTKAGDMFLPVWLYETLSNICTSKDFEALLRQAPLDLRVNPMYTTPLFVQKTLKSNNIISLETSYSPLGLRVQGQPSLKDHPLFKKGWIDVQSQGSQIIALLCAPTPNLKILDLCAGGGGKTLALSELLGGQGQIWATDKDPKRLLEAQKRTKARNISNVQFLPWESLCKTSSYLTFFDLVLIDAPCTGTGTLRRHPELKISLAQSKVADFCQSQASTLDQAHTLVKTGGILVYATCSLLEEENDAQTFKFLKRFPNFSLLDAREVCDKVLKKTPKDIKQTLQLLPGSHEEDGFYVALLKKSAELS